MAPQVHCEKGAYVGGDWVPIEECGELFNIDKDTMLARTVVTKMIYDYIKEHKLQVEEDKRKINPDEALTDLFDLKEGDELSFKSFQTHMKKLYPSKAKSTTKVANA